MIPDKNALLEAVNLLIQDDQPGYKKDALEVVGRTRSKYPVKLTGDLADLNPLLALQHDDATAYERIKALIDMKRVEAGLPPIWPEPEPPKFADRKNEYQRELMATIRQRERRASDIENMQRPEHNQLRGNARLEFQRMVTNEWGKSRNATLAKAALAAGRKLTKDEIDIIRDNFWVRIDRELDEKEEAVRQELLKPPHQRRPV